MLAITLKCRRELLLLQEERVRDLHPDQAATAGCPQPCKVGKPDWLHITPSTTSVVVTAGLHAEADSASSGRMRKAPPASA